MRKILYTLVLVLVGALATPADAISKKVWAKVALTADSTVTYQTDGYTWAQVTVTKDDGTPDGTLSVVTRPSATGGQTTVVTGYVPAGTKTYEGHCQNILEVTLASATTGTIGVEVVLW